MSRSYRKNPWTVDGQNSCKKEVKRQANRVVRNSEDVPNGGAFKKFFCSWNIADYRWYNPKPIADKIRFGRLITLEKQLEDYKKAKRK